MLFGQWFLAVSGALCNHKGTAAQRTVRTAPQASGVAVVKSEIQTLLANAVLSWGPSHFESQESVTFILHGFGPKICYFYPFRPISYQAYRPEYLHFYSSGDQSFWLVFGGPTFALTFELILYNGRKLDEVF